MIIIREVIIIKNNWNNSNNNNRNNNKNNNNNNSNNNNNNNNNNGEYALYASNHIEYYKHDVKSSTLESLVWLSIAYAWTSLKNNIFL